MRHMSGREQAPWPDDASRRVFNTMSDQHHIVICGAGIIGLSTAFHLSRLDPTASITVLDSSPELFACASGRAAGFLASNWFASPTASLGALSFRLHKELADEFDGESKWGYAPSVAYSIASVGAGGKKGEDWLFEGTSRSQTAANSQAVSSSSVLPSWLAPTPAEIISSPETTAQV
jgi:glycine/D-amino acid oxidase-like deaminating enzyme